MKSAYTAVIQRDGKWWIGWIEEMPGVNAQSSTRDDLLNDLKIAVTESLAMDPAAASSVGKDAYEEVTINTSDGECVVFTPVRDAKVEASFRKALETVNARFGRAMKRLAE